MKSTLGSGKTWADGGGWALESSLFSTGLGPSNSESTEAAGDGLEPRIEGVDCPGAFAAFLLLVNLRRASIAILELACADSASL